MSDADRAVVAAALASPGLNDVGRKALVGLVLAAVRSRTPLSIVRLGEGEGRLLVADPGDTESMGVARRKIRRQTGQKLDDAAILAIRDRIVEAVDDADVLGIRGDTSFNEEHAMWVSRIEAWVEARHAGRPAGKLLSHCLLNGWLDDALDGIVAGQIGLSVVSCRNIEAVMAARFGITDVRTYKVPSQFVVRQFDDAYEADMHDVRMWPEVVHRLEREIVVRWPGEIFLIGAGLFGKHLCTRVRAQGGIALDYGSRLDFLVGKPTRGAKKRQAMAEAAARQDQAETQHAE